MTKKIIRLTESGLRQMIKENVARFLNEWHDEDDYGRKLKTVPDLDCREIISDLPQMSDKDLEDIINGVTYNPQDFSTEYDDGYDYYVWVTEEAEDEYARRHKDYAMQLAAQRSSYGRHYYNPKDYTSPSQSREDSENDNRKGNQAKAWKDYEEDNYSPAEKRLGKWYNKKMPVDDRIRGSIGYLNKHNYNGRKPDSEKLHTKGSLNRDLRSIDRNKK